MQLGLAHIQDLGTLKERYKKNNLKKGIIETVLFALRTIRHLVFVDFLFWWKQATRNFFYGQEIEFWDSAIKHCLHKQGNIQNA